MYRNVKLIPLCLALCMMLGSCLPPDKCIKYQDIAVVQGNNEIDSIVTIVNNSILECEYWDNSKNKVVGSEIHNIQFPVNMRVQIFSEGNLWRELSLKMPKNTLLTIYRGFECLEEPSPASPLSFRSRVKSAKKDNRLIDSFQTDDYCWLLERMDDAYEHERCTELQIGGTQDIC